MYSGESMVTILFVCTGNVFRSMIAEKCLEQFIKQENILDVEVDSAGIAPIPQEPMLMVIERLRGYGITGEHHYKEISKDLIARSDVVVALNLNHQHFIQEHFGVYAPLFNKVAFGKEEGILDTTECFPQDADFEQGKGKEEFEKYVISVVEHIHDAIPSVVDNISKWA